MSATIKTKISTCVVLVSSSFRGGWLNVGAMPSCIWFAQDVNLGLYWSTNWQCLLIVIVAATSYNNIKYNNN